MPANKQAAFRYRVLDTCFRKHRGWTIEELREEIAAALWESFGVDSGVSRRQIFYDMELMKSEPPRGYNAPIDVKDGRYFYTDRKFSIMQQPLTARDMATLRDALMVLAQFRGLPMVQPLDNLLKRLDGWIRFPDKNAIRFETNELSAGTEWLPTLFGAIMDKRALELQYFPFVAEEAFSFVFHPYHLREYRNRWFVFGLNASSHTIYNLALDRIQSMQEAAVPFRTNTMFDPDDYFKDIIGVTRPEGATPVEITFRTTVLQSKYLQTKPLHPSQKMLGETANGVLFSIQVIPNYELLSELLRFGRSLEVISPAEVIDSMNRV
jgi:predicted DNA-binding transcriptional regulator YafY